MPSEKAVAYIDQAAKVLELNGVGYTGGEPFLVYPQLKELMNYTSTTYGLPGGVVTNCFWAENPKIASKKIDELYQCGLRNMVVSLDSFHLDFVSLVSIKNVVASALNYDLTLTVNTVVTRSGKIAKQDVPNLLAIEPSLIENGQVTIKEFGPLKIGRAKKCINSEDYIETENVQYFNGNCSFVIKTPSIAPDGSIFACCCFGDTAKNPQELIGYCGNAHKNNLTDIFLAMQNNLLLNILREKGPYTILKILQENNPNLPIAGKYLSNCAVCVELYHNPAVKKALLEFLNSLAFAQESC